MPLSKHKSQLMVMRFVYMLVILSPFTVITAKNIPFAKNKLAHFKQIASKSLDQAIVCTTTVTPDSSETPKFHIENADLSLCTHLICVNNIWDKSITFWSPSDTIKEKNYERFVNLRQKYPQLKISLSIKYFRSAYARLAENDESRQAFVEKATDFIARHKFDGLDLMWDFTDRSDDDEISSGTASNVLNLVKELKTSFKKYNLLLTTSFITADTKFTSILDIPTISKYVNFMHLIPKYDYVETWPGSYRIEDVLRDRGIVNLERSVDHLIKLGVPSTKIVIGLHFVGLSFHSFVDLSTKYATFRRSLTYNEICEQLVSNDIVHWESFYDDESGLAIARRESTPFGVFRPTDVILYENSRSIAKKILFILSRNLGGAMAFPIDMDDIRGNCGIEDDAFIDFIRGHHLHIPKHYNITQPLLKTINFAFRIAIGEETQARLSDKSKFYHASDRMSNFEIADDITARIPDKYKAFTPLIYMINDAIVVGIDRFMGRTKTGRNEPQIIETPSITSLITSIPNLPMIVLSFAVGMAYKMIGY